MPRVKLSQNEQKLVNFYFELLERYKELEADKMLPLVGVRLLFLTKGYDNTTSAIRRWGVDAVSTFAQRKLQEMAQLWAYMMHNDPPPDEVKEQIKECIKMTRAAAEDKAVSERMRTFLTRIEIREQWMREKTAQPKRSVQ